MAAKKHKAKKSSISRRRKQWPWSELPPTNSSLRPHNHLTVGSRSAVTKSWLPPSARCDTRQCPQLRLVPTAAASKSPNNAHHSHSHFLVDGSSIEDAVCELPDTSHWCYLRSDPKPQSPPPPTVPSYRLGPHFWLRGVFLGPNAPTSALIVNYTTIHQSSNRCRQISIRHECTAADPFHAEKKFLELTNLVFLQGEYYATSLQGALAVMQVIGTRLMITAVSAIRAVPFSDSRFFKEYMFEMKGEILLVFLIHRRYLAVVDHVEVFRLDLDKLGWVKVKRLRGDEGCIWVDSEKFGCRDDRVYFTQGLMEKRSGEFMI